MDISNYLDSNSVFEDILQFNNIFEVNSYLLDKINLVLIMSVEPGKSGQKFINVSDKINKLKQEIINRKLNVKISVDGGINEEVLTYVKEADILVSSSFILSDLDKNVDILKNS